MAIFYNLAMEAVNGTSTDPTNSAALNFNENSDVGLIVAKITGFDPQEDLSKVILTPDTANGAPGDDFGRYGIRWDAGFNSWVVYLKRPNGDTTTPASTLWNFEDKNGPTNVWTNTIQFSVGFQTGYTPKADYGLAFTFNIQNVNEAVSAVNFGAQSTITGGTTGAGATVVKATWVDPDLLTAFKNNKYAFLVGGNLLTVDGKFTINETTGQITTNQAITSTDGTSKDLIVVAYDVGNNTLQKQQSYQVAITQAAPTPPTIAAATTTVSGESTGTVYPTPFNGALSVSYGNDLDPLTVEVSFAAANGAFQGQVAGGDATTKIYSFTGTKSQVNAWLAGLQFNPTDSYSGAGQNTTFTVQVKPQGAGAWSASSTAITVAADINNNAAFTAGAGDQAVSVGATITPFAAIALTDAENDDVTLTVTFAAGGGTWGGLTSGGGVTVVNNAGTGSITFTGKALAVSNFLDNVTFTPTAAGTKTFSYTVVDQHTGTGQHTAVAGAPSTVTATAPNQAPTDPTAAATINERSGDGTPVLVMDDFDDDGQAISYTFAVAQDAAHKISLDGKFRIENNKIVVNAPNGTTLSEVAQDTTLPNYAIIADDGSGAPNGTVTGNVSITVKNVPLLSIAAITTGPVVEGDAGFVDYVFRVTRDSTGSTSTATWTVSGTGIDANDFQDLTGIVSFSGTDIFQNITLKVRADRVAELAETFTVTLGNLQGAAINPGQGSATGSITDDDNAPSFAIRAGQETHSGDVGTAIAGILSGVDIDDLDGDDLTLTVSFQNVKGELAGMVPGGGVQVTDNGTDGNGVRKFTLMGSATAIETFLAAVTFTAAAAGQTDFSFTVTDTFNPIKTFTNAVNVVGTVPDNPPPPTPSGTHTVHEGKTNGFVVKTLPLKDGAVDIGYTFENPMNDTGGKVSEDGRFEIVGNEIRVRGGVDWVPLTADYTRTYRITATDGVTPVTGGVTITVKNNVGPTIAPITASGSGQAGANGTIVVSENAGAVEIGTVTASDPDANLDGRTLSYSLADTHNGLFTIDATGKIKIANADRLQVGADTPYQLTVRVSDGSIDDVATQTITVVVKDAPVNPPNNAPTGLSLSNASVLEYTLPGAEIGTLSAADANGDVLTYTLLDNAGGRFAISSGNKLVLAGPGVNFEEAASHQIKVRVADGHGGVQDQVFTINVGDQLTLNKRGTKKADKMNGSALDDILKGGTGTAKDIIKGLAGDDQLFGENGDDSLLGGDGIDSLFGGKGNDTLKGEAGKDLLKGEAGNDKMYGGIGNDALFGGKGNDLLKGDADDDVLNGEEGHDKLYGGAGNDTFVFNKKTSKAANFDQIYDFKSGQDKLFLDNAVFKKLGTTGTFDVPAKLDVTMFKANKATDKNDYLVYKGGVLYYDADGSGKGAAVEIVKVKGLKVTDIWVI
ncbi:cadherin domain-containing protein [Microvirga mediterraneensis]|uniref:Cadherin domain-containing protein n=1 Tax=Microvirga mediterraneensis TaxID=2754695 RepID=A0A838BVX6_9HYPH|nr:cadherin domain-containing protein [Microvirga mediterraneensis]MBA1158666.1 cadherin domain-containing protein [Microvirga mediterraneensis]